MAHGWPGNLRELKNVVEYACSMCAQGDIGVDDLPNLQSVQTVLRAGDTQPMATSAAAVATDTDALLMALRAAHWNVSAVARDLGLSRMTLYRRMKRAGIVAPNRA